MSSPRPSKKTTQRRKYLASKTKHLFSGALICFGGENKSSSFIKIRSTIFFFWFKIDQSSATPMKSSRRDPMKHMAEHRCLSLKNSQNTHYSLIFRDGPVFSHINGKLSPKSFERGRTQTTWPFLGHILTPPPPLATYRGSSRDRPLPPNVTCFS